MKKSVPLSLNEFQALAKDRLSKLRLDIKSNPLDTWQSQAFMLKPKKTFFCDDRLSMAEQCSLFSDSLLGKLAICLAMRDEYFDYHAVELVEFKLPEDYKINQPKLAFKVKNEFFEVEGYNFGRLQKDANNYQILPAWAALYSTYLIFQSRLNHNLFVRQELSELAYRICPEMYLVREELIDVYRLTNQPLLALEICEDLVKEYASPIALDFLAKNTGNPLHKQAWQKLFIKKISGNWS